MKLKTMPKEPGQCRVKGCTQPATDRDHIINKQLNNAGGCDCPVNYPKTGSLCRWHHTVAHAMPKRTFYHKHGLGKLYERAWDHYLERCRGVTRCASAKMKNLIRLRQGGKDGTLGKRVQSDGAKVSGGDAGAAERGPGAEA